jgi:hypothetical protein
MSNIYIQEPATRGKVILETTVGDIEIVRINDYTNRKNCSCFLGTFFQRMSISMSKFSSIMSRWLL